MYPDVGNEIKKLAKTVVILVTIPAVLIAIVLFALCATTNQGLYVLLGLAVGAGIIGVTYFFGRMAMILLYGYGELIDEVKEIRQKINPQTNPTPSPKPKANRNPNTNPNKDPALLVTRNSDGTWNCAFCDHLNKADAKSCAECDVVPNFE